MNVRVPSAKVPRTSGQGVSRKAYQTARALGFKGTGSPGTGSAFRVSMKGGSPRSGVSQHPRDYAKLEHGPNIDFGETFNPPTDKDMWPGDDK